MLPNRRCGVSSLFILATLAVLALAPASSLAQITMVQSSARYAGSGAPGYNGDFGSATTVSLNTPSYIVFDSNGNQYISDTLNNCVRKIDIAGNVTTVAGLAVSGQGDTCNTASNPTPTAAQGLYQPTGLAIDTSNRLYIADSMHHCVRSLASSTSGVANLTTVAGTCGSSPAASATPAPNGLAIDSTGNLYISVQDSVSATPVYQVLQHLRSALPQSVCYLAGAPSLNVTIPCAGITNGVSLVKPSGLAIDVNDDLFIADTGNNCVREVVGLSTQTTSVGQCLNDGTGTAATAVHNPYGIAVTPTQSLFISESNPHNILSYTPGTSSIVVIGGLPSGVAGPYNSAQDGKSALSSSLNNPRGLAVDANSHLFVADSSNSIARELSSNLFFSNTPVSSPSAIQPITFAINQPVDLSVTAGTDYSITSTTCSGNLSPAAGGASPNTCQVFVRFTPTRPGQRKSPLKLTDSVSGKSFFSSLQGIGTGALGLFTPGAPATIANNLSLPTSIAVDSTGNAYVLETSGTTSDLRLIPVAGGASQVILSSAPGQITPTAIASDAAGNWFVADASHGTIARIGADGTVNLSFITGLDTPVAIFADGSDNLFIAQNGGSHNVIEVYGAGVRSIIAGSGSSLTVTNGVPATTVSFVTPSALAADLNGTLYIADQGAHQVYAVDKSGIIHIVAGNGTTSTTNPGQATGTAIIAPSSLSIDAAGDIYVADQSTGIVYTVYTSVSNGSNIVAILNTSAPPSPNGPLSIALDGSSNLFIARTATNSVLELSYPNPILNFGTILAGNTSPVQLQSFVNVGTDNLNINNPFSTSDNHFTVDTNTTTCGTSIITGSVCNLGFAFTPTANTTYTATSIISSNSFNTPQPISLTGIGKLLATISVSLPSQTEVYGQPFPETVIFGNITTAPTGIISFTTGGQTLCALSGTLAAVNTCNAANSGLSVGTYTVTFNYSGDTNYKAASGTVALTVTPAPLSESVHNATRAFGAANPTFSGTLTGVVSGDTVLVSFATTATTSSPVGTYPITATLTTAGTTNLANYIVTNTPGTLSITQASLSFTLIPQTEIYGQPFPETVNISNFVNGIAPTGTLSYTIGKSLLCNLTGTLTPATTCNAANSGLSIGTYTVTFSYTGDANYAPYSSTTTLTVTAAPLTVTVNNATRGYGTVNPTFTSTISGAVQGDTFTNTFSTSATITSPVGTYPIQDVIVGPSASNYTITVVPGTLTITKATIVLNVAASSASRIYGAANPAFSATVSGALNGDTFTITYATTATITSPVGTYPIVPTVLGPAAANYTVTTTNGILTVTAAPLTVTANNATRTYGAANPTFSGTTAGLLNGDSVSITYSTPATATSPVGTYPIIPTVTATSNYNVTVVNGTLSVTANAASLIINVNSAARRFGQVNPAFSGTVAGVIPGDDVIVTYNTTATPVSPAGNYPIGASVSGTSASNYIATIHPGILAISPSSTVTTVTTSGTPAVGGTSVTFTATVVAASGIATGTINFLDGTTLLGTGTLNAGAVATFSTSALTIGSHSISAAFQASTNFIASTGTLTQVITQPTGSFTISANPPAPFIRGAGTTTYQVTVASVGAFNGPIALTCSGLPSDATCSFGSPIVTLATGGTATTTMTVTTTVADARLQQPTLPGFNPGALAPITAAAVFPIELTGLGVLFAGIRRRKTLGTQKMRLLLMIVFTLGILGLVGCGCPNTAFKTYTINITGTSVTFPAPAQATSVVLSVGQ